MKNVNEMDLEATYETRKNAKHIIYDVNETPPWTVIFVYSLQVRLLLHLAMTSRAITSGYYVGL